MQIRQYNMMNLSNANGRKVKGKSSLPTSSFHPSANYLNFNNNINERPLNQYSRELSFKGLSLNKVVQNNKMTIENYNLVLDKVRSVVGKTFDEDVEEILKIFPNRVKKDGNNIEFKRKSMMQMLGEGVIYPVSGMFVDLGNFAFGGLRKVPGLKTVAGNIYEAGIFKSRRDKAALESKFNGVMGMFDQVTDKMTQKDISNDKLESWIMQLAHKSYKPTTGKYSSVYERPLNRIVSGGIPAFFLANDAFNLSSYCDDNPELAKKEHDIRFNQEVARVGFTAYINFILLSGLTKFVNGSMIGTALSSTIPVIVAETSSRLMNGKSITFISKEKAREMAKESGLIQINQGDDKNKNDVIYKYYSMPVAFQRAEQTFMSFKGVNGTSAFDSFNSDKIFDVTAGIVSQSIAKRDKANANNEKGLITLSSILKATAASIFGGYAFIYARKNSRSFDVAVEKFFSYFKEGYKKFVTEDFEISKKDFNKIMVKIRRTQPELAARYEKIALDYKMDCKKLGELLDEIKDDKTLAIFDELINGKSEIIKERRNFLKKHNINIYTLKRDLDSHIERVTNINKKHDVYVLDRVNKKIKPAVDFVISPFRFMWSAVKLPHMLVSKLIGMFGKQAPRKADTDIRMLTNVINDYKNTLAKPNKVDFEEYIKDGINRSADNTTKSSYDNADLAKVQKLVHSSITTWFLIADDHNMVMMKSLGEDEDGAVLKAKERAQQRITGIFYQTMFIDLFNNTFRSFYNASLMGMSVVTAACTMVCEVFTRKSIGKPVGKMSRDEINELEYKNNTAPGLKGKYFRFMSQLTGKKAISADSVKKQPKKEEKAVA